MNNVFLAYDIRGKVGTELTDEFCEKVGRAFGEWLPEDGPVAVGRDMRPDSEELANALIKGLTTQGRDVIDLGQITSDMSYFAVGKYELAGAAMVTASHNPGAYNGIKLYRDHVKAVGLDSGLDIIRDLVADNVFVEPETVGTVTEKNILDDWAEHVLTFVEASKWPKYRVAIDAGNGMAGAILPTLMKKLPVDVTDELYWDLDGTFPNHLANPQKVETLTDLIKVVQEKKLDFGMAFDGDGDRAGFVDNLGRPVSGSDLITICSRLYLDKYPGTEVVHEVRTSLATRELITAWGGTPIRTKAGRVSIGTVMRERGAAFGGETTGHLFFKENYFADSGVIAALCVVEALACSGKKLSDLVDEYHLYHMKPEINFKISDTPTAVFDRLMKAFPEAEVDLLDGLSLDFADGSWVNVRASNTEPLLRLNAEAKTEDGLNTLIHAVSEVIGGENE
jgi:phosphomannomutase